MKTGKGAQKHKLKRSSRAMFYESVSGANRALEKNPNSRMNLYLENLHKCIYTKHTCVRRKKKLNREEEWGRTHPDYEIQKKKKNNNSFCIRFLNKGIFLFWVTKLFPLLPYIKPSHSLSYHSSQYSCCCTRCIFISHDRNFDFSCFTFDSS